MVNFHETLISIIGSYQFLLLISIVALLVKIYVLSGVLSHKTKNEKVQKPLIFICLFILCTMISDIAWATKCLKMLFLPTFDPRIYIFITRIAWAGFVVQYTFLLLFIESLINKSFKTKIWHKVFMAINFSLSSYILYKAFFKYNDITKTPKELLFLTWISSYIIISIFVNVYVAIKRIRTSENPKIIKNQLKVFTYNIIVPLLVSEIIQAEPAVVAATHLFTNIDIIIATIPFVIQTYAIYFAIKKVMGMRFLNFKSHVAAQTIDRSNFIDYFKETLEQLGHITTKNELGHVVQMFFNDVLNIPFSRTKLYIRNFNQSKQEVIVSTHETSTIEKTVEHFIGTNQFSNSLVDALSSPKILIKDEIEFNDFYSSNETDKFLASFLENIGSEVFLPIYKKENIVGYITIEIDQNSNKMYSNVERDKMVVFASYLGNVIDLLQNKNLYVLIQKDKELQDELHNKHQEINQYKESIRSFLRHDQEHRIGMISYKNRRFSFVNHVAASIIKINPNSQEGHSLSKDLRKLAHQVEEYKSVQDITTMDTEGRKLMLHGIPNPDGNVVFILAHYPKLSDTIKSKINELKDPTKWDYLLYLETTKSGKIINQLIPGSGETLLNFKIDLLKMALNKKALLLDMPEEDLTATVEIIHHISLRENLQILSLSNRTESSGLAIKLFGLNAIFGQSKDPALLKKLDKIGTLFIKNIHLMSLEAQQYLAEYLRYGFYKIFKSDIKVWTDVRIICSSNQNLRTLTQEGSFSEALYNELSKTSISMPSLLKLSNDELNSLAEGYSQQTVKSQDLKSILKLSENEKHRLIDKQPVSLHEFKNSIQNLMINKSKKCDLYEEAQFDPAYNVTDPDLIEAVRLGKHALRDPKIMVLLWNKFKSQSKIASLLGVNRSSVNRRCKEYDLL